MSVSRRYFLKTLGLSAALYFLDRYAGAVVGIAGAQISNPSQDAAPAVVYVRPFDGQGKREYDGGEITWRHLVTPRYGRVEEDNVFQVAAVLTTARDSFFGTKDEPGYTIGLEQNMIFRPGAHKSLVETLYYETGGLKPPEALRQFVTEYDPGIKNTGHGCWTLKRTIMQTAARKIVINGKILNNNIPGDERLPTDHTLSSDQRLFLHYTQFFKYSQEDGAALLRAQHEIETARRHGSEPQSPDPFIYRRRVTEARENLPMELMTLNGHNDGKDLGELIAMKVPRLHRQNLSRRNLLNMFLV